MDHGGVLMQGSADDVENCTGAPPLPTGFEAQSTLSGSKTLPECTKNRNWSEWVVEELKNFLHVLTPDGRFVYLSSGGEQLTGYPREEVMVKFIVDFITQMTVRWFFMIARPYPTKNAILMVFFLEHKIENERLRNCVEYLKREVAEMPRTSQEMVVAMIDEGRRTRGTVRRQYQVWWAAMPQEGKAVLCGALGCRLTNWLKSRQVLGVMSVALPVMHHHRILSQALGFRNGEKTLFEMYSISSGM
ncbi:hypothetical protein DL98DRAFT_598712 [Cadophora sp. DSE1049]|nr:hypothetical protein DL98DRAFT_598712 [Cadophora sp. DSE1049]